MCSLSVGIFAKNDFYPWVTWHFFHNKDIGASKLKKTFFLTDNMFLNK